MDHDEVLVEGADFNDLAGFVPAARVVPRLILDDHRAAKLKGFERFDRGAEPFLQLCAPDCQSILSLCAQASPQRTYQLVLVTWDEVPELPSHQMLGWGFSCVAIPCVTVLE